MGRRSRAGSLGLVVDGRSIGTGGGEGKGRGSGVTISQIPMGDTPMHANSLLPSELFGKIVRYEIPEFQRPYVWDQEEQWEPLWEDVRDTAEHYLDDGEGASHFMGAIVLQEVPKGARGFQTHMVVDGQQRLTTLQLLLDCRSGGSWTERT